MLNEVIHGDCLEVMRGMADKSIDLILTDPPYGIGADSKMHKFSGMKPGRAAAPKGIYPDTDWDDGIPSKEIFDEMRRISKNQVIFGGNYFAEYLGNSSCWLVWDKNNGENNFADCELAWTSFKTAVRIFRYTWNGMIQEDMKNKEVRFHPTQKPLELMKWCLDKYSEEGMTVLDPFAGSGSTLVACKQMNRNFIGIEREKQYVDVALTRLSQGLLL